MTPIINPNKEQIEEYLSKIKWSLKQDGEKWFFYNHKNEKTDLYFCSRKVNNNIYNILQTDSKNIDNTPEICFALRDVRMAIIDENCLYFFSIDKCIFIRLKNFDISPIFELFGVRGRLM